MPLLNGRCANGLAEHCDHEDLADDEKDGDAAVMVQTYRFWILICPLCPCPWTLWIAVGMFHKSDKTCESVDAKHRTSNSSSRAGTGAVAGTDESDLHSWNGAAGFPLGPAADTGCVHVENGVVHIEDGVVHDDNDRCWGVVLLCPSLC